MFVSAFQLPFPAEKMKARSSSKHGSKKFDFGT
jgi:hypothetical protein